MKIRIVFYIFAVALFFFYLRELEAIPVEELPDSTTCGVYGENLESYVSGPFSDQGGTLEGYANGNKVFVLVKRVHTDMCRDKGKFPRYWVEVKFNNHVVLTLSHTDIPFAINTYIGKSKYRVICVDN